MPPRKANASKPEAKAGSSHKKRSGSAAAAARMDISDEEEEEASASSASDAEEEEEEEESASESASGSGSGSGSDGSDEVEGEEESGSSEGEEEHKKRGRGKQPRKKPAAASAASSSTKATASAKQGRKRTRDDEAHEDDAAASSSSAAAPPRAVLAISSFDSLASSPPPGLPSLQLPQLPLSPPLQKSRGSTRQIRKPAAIDDNVSDGEQHKPKRRSTAAAASSSSSAAAADSSSSTAAAAAASASAAPAPIDPDELSDEWRCNANASVFFRLVRPAPEKDSRDSTQPPTETLQFHPHYTHQLWDDEEIVGYKRVKCVVAFTSGALYTYLHAEYESKVSNAGIPDLTDLIGAKLKGGYTTSWADFQSHIHDEFRPPGELMAEYSLPSVEETSKKEVISYEVYRGTFSDATLRAYHARLQFFLLFFIDRSSFINDTDLVWEVILLFQKRVCLSKGVTTYHIVGYTTLYKFLSYPEDWKMRLSQILILPPFQRVGHGQKLLSLVYAEAEKRRMIEVNIEDPSPVFQMLRDLTDIQIAKKHRFFEKNGDFDPLESWNVDYAKKVKSALRITLAQVRRCYEIFKLNAINDRHKNSKPMTAYRLEVKSRLFRSESEVLSLYSSRPEERKEKLQEIYKELEEHYLAVIKKARLH